MAQFLTASPDIDVDEIMESVRRRIEERRQAGAFRDEEIQAIAALELQPLPDYLEIPSVYEGHLFPAGQPAPAPHPHAVFTEESEAGAAKRLLAAVRRLLWPLVRFFARPLYNELKRDLTVAGNRAIDVANEQARMAHEFKPILFQGREYIKLLHHVANNAIAEITRLRAEVELLKTRVRVAEEKAEFVENRERALEKRLGPS